MILTLFSLIGDLNTVKMAPAKYHHGNLRQALLNAAEKLVEQTGPEDLSLRRLAREAGVSPAAPYHHFESRQALLAALSARGFQQLGAAMRRATGRQGDGGALERLQAAGIAYVRFAVSKPALFRLMFSGFLTNRSEYGELQRSADETFDVLSELVGETRGTRPSTDTASPVALTAWSTVHGLATLLIDGRLDVPISDRKASALAKEVTRTLGRGLRAP